VPRQNYLHHILIWRIAPRIVIVLFSLGMCVCVGRVARQLCRLFDLFLLSHSNCLVLCSLEMSEKEFDLVPHVMKFKPLDHDIFPTLLKLS
jgi:hypothetical protein